MPLDLNVNPAPKPNTLPCEHDDFLKTVGFQYPGDNVSPIASRSCIIRYVCVRLKVCYQVCVSATVQYPDTVSPIASRSCVIRYMYVRLKVCVYMYVSVCVCMRVCTCVYVSTSARRFLSLSLSAFLSPFSYV